MNIARLAVLSVAVVAAGGAALLVRGGMNTANQARKVVVPVQTTAAEDVLVASGNIEPGKALDPALVRWQAWPKAAVEDSFIIKSKQPDSAKAVAGFIVRAPLVNGQPITDSNIVHANTTGFMAATLGQGMRAISIPVTVDTDAGGFILPNDRVDVLLTRDTGGTGSRNFQSETLLKDVRVLAIDQVIQLEKDRQAVVGRTATLELTPKQTEEMAQAVSTGVISLALHSLGDSEGIPITAAPVIPPRFVAARAAVPPAIRVYKAGVLQVGGVGVPAGGQAGLTGVASLQTPFGSP